MGAWPVYPVSLYTPKECNTQPKRYPRRTPTSPLLTGTGPYNPSTLQLASCDRRLVLLDVEEKRLITPLMESLKPTDKSFTIRTHGYSHETRLVLDFTRVRVSQTHLVLLARTLKGSKGTQCTQFVDRHVQIGLRMRATRTGPVYRQIDKDRPSHDLSNNT